MSKSKRETQGNENARPVPVAIVGIGGLFPSSPELEQFWKVIVERVDTARDVPAGRWPMAGKAYTNPDLSVPDTVPTARACFLDEIPLDCKGLSVDEDWVRGLDPLFHLTLMAGRRAWEDARTDALNRDRVGVLIANIVLPTDGSSEISHHLLASAVAGRPVPHGEALAPANRHAAGLPAGLLAQALGLGAGATTLDAACASSLYAIELACEELQAGRVDAMLSGGVSRPCSLYTQQGFSRLTALSRSGRCSPFDAAGDGLVVGEGAGFFILKRLPDALKHGDHVYGVIRGVGLSNDTGGSLLAPDSEGQLRAMRSAYAEAGWSPTDVDLIECHGTGTPTGDVIEYDSMRKLWKDEDWTPGQCIFGSVKSNVGHLLTGAGAAGMMKVLLALKNETLPPSANWKRANPKLDYAGGPFRIAEGPEAWKRRNAETPRRAAVSAFGFGGINGHVLVEEWRPEITPKQERARVELEGNPTVELGSNAPAVAIVGMGAHVGSLKNLREVQEALLSGRTALRPRPATRWSELEASPWAKEQNLIALPKLGAWLEDGTVPIGRYRISPREFDEMLPQQTLILQSVDEALVDAGMRDETRRLDTGTFVGVGLDFGATNFFVRWALPHDVDAWLDEDGGNRESRKAWLAELCDGATPPLSANRVTGALGGIVASRVAREFSVGGPSFTISAEENSGLRAFELAVRALERKAIDRAIVGAVDLAGDIRNLWAVHSRRPYGTTPPRPLDEAAAGAAPGEGAVAFVLKRLDEAVADGNRIYCVVRGIGLASGGGCESAVTEPAVLERAMRNAYADAGLAPDCIELLEAHGSGFPAEDRAEALALRDVFGSIESERPRCALTSTKALVGHTGCSSGLVSLLRAALALHQEILPPAAAFEHPRRELLEGGSFFHAPRNPSHWLRDRCDGPRRAAVNALACDGTAVHVVLEGHDGRGTDVEAVTRERLQPLGARDEALFLAQGEDERVVARRLGELAALAESESAPIEGLARKWFAGHPLEAGKRTAAVVARDGASLKTAAGEALERLTRDAGPPETVPANARVFWSASPLASEGKTALVFPGAGNYFLGMGMETGRLFPEVLRAMDEEEGSERLRNQFSPWLFHPWSFDWVEGWEKEGRKKLLADHDRLTFGHVVYGVMMTDLLKRFFPSPDMTVAYSLGESTCHFATRTWRDRDEMVERLRKSSLFKTDLVGPCEAARKHWGFAADESLDWRLGLVACSADRAREAMKGIPRVHLLIDGAPGECVVGGRAEELERLKERLDCAFFPLDGISTIHSPCMSPVRDAYRALHHLPCTPPEAPYYSGATGGPIDRNSDEVAAAILRQAEETVDLPRLVERAYADGARLFVEVGPGNSFSRSIHRILEGRPHAAQSVCVPGQASLASLLRLLGRMAAEGMAIDLSSLYGGESPAVGLAPMAPPPRAIQKIPVAVAPIRPVRSRPTPRAPLPSTPVPPSVAARRPPESSMPLPPRSSVPASGPSLHPVLASQQAATRAASDAHEAFLACSRAALLAQERLIRSQMGMLADPGALAALAALPTTSTSVAPSRELVPDHIVYTMPPQTEKSKAYVATAPRLPSAPNEIFFDRDLAMEYALRSIGKCLGPQFAEIDDYPSRVRLPDDVLNFVDRMMLVEGTPGQLGTGRCVTEHDVRPGIWYLDNGRIPTGVAVEAGQADLFLGGYLGIDFKTRGKANYRLLDAVVTYHDHLPRIGDTIRYDIRIDRFIRQADTYMFFFSFDGTVEGRKLITMREGCAGFFTPHQLSTGRGLVLTDEDTCPMEGKKPPDWRPPLTIPGKLSFDDEAMRTLRRGDLPGAFGAAFEGLPLQDPLTMPMHPNLKLADRVTEIDPKGGRFGLGSIKAEIDIQPDSWFLTTHFSDDMVMPGTLMYESCMQAMKVFLLRMGWVGERSRCCFEPIPEIQSRLRCRGQVIPGVKKALYDIAVKEIGYRPEPYVLADAIMWADGRQIVQVLNMSIRLTGTSREELEGIWAGRGQGGSLQLPAGSAFVSAPAPQAPVVPAGDERLPAVYDYEKILAYADGLPSDAFGEACRVFDEGKFLARLPRPPYLFLDRIARVDGEPFVMKAGGTVIGQYDVPPDAWYFDANRQDSMPFSVLLEFPLQICGWYAAYVGSALTSEQELHFRNLDGTATMHEEVGRDAGTLTARIDFTKCSQAGGMIIQEFDFAVTRLGRPIYSGHTGFGFFSEAALAQQFGVRGAQPYEPTDAEKARAISVPLPHLAPMDPTDTRREPGSGLVLPGRCYSMHDVISLFVPDGGPAGLGFVRGEKDVDPGEWFFQAHFRDDPVIPGSLGLEAFIQLMKVAARHRWQGLETSHRFEPIAKGVEHVWAYRGQVIPKNGRVTVDACIESVKDDDHLLMASGYLKVDGLVIYKMQNFGLRAVPS